LKGSRFEEAIKIVRKKESLRLMGLVAAVYGAVALAFEALNITSGRLSNAVLAALNPLFALYVASSDTAKTVYSMSVFGNVSTTPSAVGTLLFWGAPILLIVVGVAVAAFASD
jgi:hypothetical protein